MKHLVLIVFLVVFACPVQAQQDPPPEPVGVVAAPVAPVQGSGSSFDAAEVVERTVLALRIRLLVETWPVADSAAEGKTEAERRAWDERAYSFERRLKAAAASVPEASSARLDTQVVRFAYRPSPQAWSQLPPRDCLRETLDLLESHYPRSTTDPGVASAATAGVRTAAGMTYTVFSPAGSALASEPAAGGAGVSFQQALIEGTTAFLLDRARADVARAGLERFQDEVRSSTLRDAFPQTLALSGFTGAGSDAYRDPRLYLGALQAALADDFDGLPVYVTSTLRASTARGLEPYHWEIAHQSLGLVADVQRGTHPLLALSTFSGQTLEGAPADLRRRMLELHALSTALYAGSGTVGGQSFATRRVLDTLDGRRLFAIFLAEELRDVSAGSCGAVSDCVDGVEARVVSLRQTLDEIVREVASLRTTFAQIQAASPAQAGTVYADYIAVVTRAIRQVVIDTQDVGRSADALRVLDEIERILSIREALVRRDYPGAVAGAMPYLAVIAEGAGGASGREAFRSVEATLVLMDGGLSEYNESQRGRGRERGRQILRQVVLLAEEGERATTVRAETVKGLEDAHCGARNPSLCADLDELDAAAQFARVQWCSVRTAAVAGTDDSLEILHGKIRASVAALRRAQDAEVWYSEQVGRTVTRAARDAVSGGDHVDAAKAIRDALSEKVTETRVGQMFVAAAAMVGSASSEDVYESLVVYAAPPGSFRDRRRGTNRIFRVSLNSYVGLTAGSERADSDSEAHVGVLLPIGLELTWATENWWLGLDRPFNWFGIGSVGVYASPLNLGTFVDYRLGSSSVDDSPAYTLEQALAPSAYVTLGLSRTLPVSLGLGGSYVPSLREVEGGGTVSATRLSAFLAVDVPLYIFR